MSYIDQVIVSVSFRDEFLSFENTNMRKCKILFEPFVPQTTELSRAFPPLFALGKRISRKENVGKKIYFQTDLGCSCELDRRIEISKSGKRCGLGWGSTALLSDAAALAQNKPCSSDLQHNGPILCAQRLRCDERDSLDKEQGSQERSP
eukprot:m.45979 g.45979  ORF g.45979 m.45979 type:complete len:149 (-) comp11065_c0_seq1:41-487(-)